MRIWQPLVVLAGLLLASACLAEPEKGSRSAEFSIGEQRCEFRHNPLGIDVSQPRLTWEIESRTRGIQLVAYQVIVTTHDRADERGEKMLWDSGRVDSSDPTRASYAGASLSTGQRCDWKVRVWDADGNASAWSPTAWWEMGLLGTQSWQAQWIDDGEKVATTDESLYTDDPAPLFRTEFEIAKPIRSARLYVAGLGYYEASLNGKRVGNSLLDPAWTAYSKRVLYSTYDVTDQLQAGSNCLGVVLGNGWYNPLPLRMWGQLNIRQFMPTGRPRCLAQLVVEHSDGTRSIITSNDRWRVAPGPIRRNSVYLGEVYDARREIPGWNTAAFDDSNWARAAAAAGAVGDLQAQSQPPIRATQEITPIARIEPKPGVYIFDFGENMAGWARLRVRGPSGTEVKLRFGELLYPDGSLNVMTTVCGQIKEAGVGGHGAPALADQSDTYILRGVEGSAGAESYEPRFTYHAFRYVEVTGFPGTPDLDAIEAVRINSDIASASKFSCSNELFNRIQKMCLTTFPSNLVGVQTDCPGRERFAYGDDIACACETHLYNYDMATFYTKTVRDFADAARPNGALTLLAPWTGHAIGGFDPEAGAFADVERNGANAGSGPLSGVLAHSLLLEKCYQFYGDRRLLEEQYDVARRSLEFIRLQAQDNLIQVGLGDWSSVVKTDTVILDTAMYYQHAKIIAKLARIIGRDDDALKYEALAAEIRAAFQRKFADGAQAQGVDTQAARACALYHGLLDQQDSRSVVLELVEDVVEKHEGHLTTGIFGTKYLLDVLTAANRSDVAAMIVNQTTYPGWGYMLERGATTLWEVWDFSDNVYSHNHSMFGTVSAWFFSALAGIQPAADAVGFDKIVLRPQVVTGLTWVKGSYHSVRGEIVSDWRIKEGVFHWQVVVPPTSTAEICFPQDFTDDVREGGRPIAEVAGIALLDDSGSTARYRISSGTFSFASRALDAENGSSK